MHRQVLRGVEKLRSLREAPLRNEDRPLLVLSTELLPNFLDWDGPTENRPAFDAFDAFDVGPISTSRTHSRPSACRGSIINYHTEYVAKPLPRACRTIIPLME